MSSNLAKELSIQINREFQAAYKYFGMATYSDSLNFDGFSNWMKVQAQEELSHGAKIYKYLVDMSQPIELLPITAPVVTYKSLQDMLEHTVTSEKVIAENFNRMVGIAMEEKDMVTYSFLEWFLMEQIEEIAHSTSILEKVKLVGNDGTGLLMIDKELKQRKVEKVE